MKMISVCISIVQITNAYLLQLCLILPIFCIGNINFCHRIEDWEYHMTDYVNILFISQKKCINQNRDLSQWFLILVLETHRSAHFVFISYLTHTVQFMDLSPNELMIWIRSGRKGKCAKCAERWVPRTRFENHWFKEAARFGGMEGT